MTRGRFVVFEGIDASGKSTHARRIATQRGALFTFEPGDTPLGGELRRWLLDGSTPMTPVTEALLMLADRSHHVATVIEPTLESGTHVIADRFYASTLAYQGYGRGVDLRDLEAATELAIGSCRPDLTVLIDIDIDVRAATRTVSSPPTPSSTNGCARATCGWLATTSLIGSWWTGGGPSRRSVRASTRSWTL